MYGLKAIQAGNGWEIAVVGISIVYTGLIFLAIFIGRIHKLLDLWENKREIKLSGIEWPWKWKKRNYKRNVSVKFSENRKVLANQFFLLIKRMDNTFSLPKLLKLAEISGVGNPYSGLCMLLDSRIIVPDNRGFYIWDNDKFKTVI